MITLRDFEMPKYLNKKKKINLYKAFILKDGEKMVVSEDIDIFGLSYEAALQFMLYSTNYNDTIHLEGQEIGYAIFTIDRSFLDTNPLVDEGNVYYVNDNISVTLKGKPYKMDVESKVIDEIKIEMSDKNEIKLISFLKFKE